MKRRLFSLSCIFGLVLALPAFANPATDIYYDGQILDTSQPVLNVQDRTMIGFRDYFEAVQAEVEWDEASRTAVTSFEGLDLFIDPDAGLVTANGQTVDLDVAPQIINDRIYLPLRFFSEAMGYQVDFQVLGQDRYRVDLTSASSQPPTDIQAPILPEGSFSIPRLGDFPASAAYYLNGDRLIEVAGLTGSIQHRTIDSQGQVSSQTFKRGGDQYIRDVYIENGEPVIVRNQLPSAPAPYVGPASPSFVQPFAEFSTSLGPVEVYGTDLRQSHYIFRNNQLAYENQDENALVLKMSQAFDPQNARWAKEGHSQAAIVDGQLLIFDQEKLYVDQATPATDFLTGEDRFYTIGVQDQTFSLGAYDLKGHVLRPYQAVASFSGSGPLYLRDSMEIGPTLYLLVANDDQTKLFIVNQETPHDIQVTNLGQGVVFTSFAQDVQGGLYAIAPEHSQYILAPLSSAS